MSDNDHLPFHDAAVSVSCPCRRWPTYYDVEDMHSFMRSRDWPHTLETIRQRFRCKICGGAASVGIVSKLKNVTRLMPPEERAELPRDFETIGERQARRKAADRARG